MMTHRGQVSKDRNGTWAGVCDCSATWNATRWRETYDAVYQHVKGYRRGQALGVGFRSQVSSRQELTNKPFAV